MFEIHDIRESRVWQEAKAEGYKEGLEEARRLLQAIPRMAARQIPPDDIAAILGLNTAVVRRELAKSQPPSV
jgi:predicted transposase YdaD